MIWIVLYSAEWIPVLGSKSFFLSLQNVCRITAITKVEPVPAQNMRYSFCFRAVICHENHWGPCWIYISGDPGTEVRGYGTLSRANWSENKFVKCCVHDNHTNHFNFRNWEICHIKSCMTSFSFKGILIKIINLLFIRYQTKITAWGKAIYWYWHCYWSQLRRVRPRKTRPFGAVIIISHRISTLISTATKPWKKGLWTFRLRILTTTHRSFLFFRKEQRRT